MAAHLASDARNPEAPMFTAARLAFHRYRIVPSFLLAILLTAGAGLPGIVPLSQSQDTPLTTAIQLMAMTELKAVNNGHFVTSADINNRAVQVLVDTGASVVALSFEDAEKVGLKPKNLKFDVGVSTANGVAKAARVMLREVEIDNVRVSDVQGLVMPKGAMRGTLLGMSFLSRLKSFSVEDGRLILKN
jgi:aspartyl protease family protein